MAPNSDLTYNYQTARQRSSCRSLASAYPPIESPTLPPVTPPQSQGPLLCELFATLLFDRKRAYQSRPCVSSAPLSTLVARAEKTTSPKRHTGALTQHTLSIPSKLHVHKEEETQPSKTYVPLPGNSKAAMMSKARTVSRKRARPTKQAPTKDVGKTTTDKPRKRAAPTRISPRTRLKRQKTEANITKKTDNKGNVGNNSMKTTLMGSFDKDIDIITIFDSEDGEYQPIRKGRIGRNEDEDEVELRAPKMNIHDDDDVKVDRAEMLHENERSDSERMQVRPSNITRQETQRLHEELEAERSSLRAAVRERDQLRIDIENSRATNDQLTRELREEKRLRESQRIEHEGILEDIMKSKKPASHSANDFLVTENGRLRTENESLRAAARPPLMPQSAFPPTPSSVFTPPPSQPSPYQSIFASQAVSPAPSSSTPPAAPITTEERKKENIRKVYIEARRRLDTLQSAAANLTSSTRGMDLSSFGQFGKYLRQLKRALNEDAKNSVERKEDEDAK